MDLKGYGGSRIDWDGTTLTITATNGAGRIGLFGEDGKNGLDHVTLTRDQIDQVIYKPGKAVLTNGLFEVQAGGRKMKVHFLRKHKDEFAKLAADLGATV